MLLLSAVVSVVLLFSFYGQSEEKIRLSPGSRISLIGGNLGARLAHEGIFDTEMHIRFPKHQLFIRNLCDPGDTPGFRPHAGRNTPWAFPGAEVIYAGTEWAKNSDSEGNFPYPDEWLTQLETDVILSFFGSAESFEGKKGLNRFKLELEAFVLHTKSQSYNRQNPPTLVLISPTAFEELSSHYDVPNGKLENENLEMYTAAMAEVAKRQNVLFVDVFHPSMKWFSDPVTYTLDGLQLNEKGYEKLVHYLIDQLFEDASVKINSPEQKALIQRAVKEKEHYWHYDYKVPNGVHIYGRRYLPFGPDNYPDEMKKVRQLTAIRDTLIWARATGRSYNVYKADQQTIPLKSIETNFKREGNISYLYDEEALSKFKLAPGFNVSLFASEKEFPDLANPCQISFDDQGRLWVAVMPTYPHYRPGDPLPNDKIIILEDVNRDGKADKQTVFAEGLHLPTGFEIAPEGVYVAQGTNLKLYQDTNGDDKADRSQILLSGFDDHDSHHVIHSFSADPSGAIYMGEGIFLHSNVETPYGPIRATHGGFMRYNPIQKKLERIAQVPVTNPWGIAFNNWGQCFVLSTSNPNVYWLGAGTVKPVYGYSSPVGKNLIEERHRVRPTSGLEFVSSRHFPEQFQGDLLLNNTIGFLGMKMHQIISDESGYKANFRLDLISSSDPNFRPVDMEFAPDGSLYLADWHNVLIGHMQHNARDPLRDHVHGRIYRITYPSRPLVTPAKIHGATVDELLENLKLPEYRSRYRSRRALRGKDPVEVEKKLKAWVAKLDPKDKNYDQHQLEALWVSWGINRLHVPLLTQLLTSRNLEVRAAALHVARFNQAKLPKYPAWLTRASLDPSGRVRMEVLTSSTWLDNKVLAKKIQANVRAFRPDSWMLPLLAFIKDPSQEYKDSNLQTKVDKNSELYTKGKVIYNKEGYCITCHQENGEGLESAGFPPLSKSNWVTGNPDRLIKLVLHGVYGPMEVNGKQYSGEVPMTPYGGLLNDEELAAVLNYIRNSFGNNANLLISTERVKEIRNQTKNRKGFYTAQELLKAHPN